MYARHLSTLVKPAVGLAKPSVGLRAAQVGGVRTFNIPFLPQIPQPPGNIVGTVNEAYVSPPPHKSHGSRHWTAERAVAIGLIPLTTVPFVTGVSTGFDAVMSSLLLYHCYTGFQSCIIDYIPLRIYGKYHNYAMYLLLFGTGVAGYGIYEIEKKEGGVTTILKKVFAA